MVSQDLLNGASVSVLHHGHTVPVTHIYSLQREEVVAGDQLGLGHCSVDDNGEVW